MTVYVVIEFTGTPAACDGAVIHGVYTTRAAAEQSPGAVQRWAEIQEFSLNGGTDA